MIALTLALVSLAHAQVTTVYRYHALSTPEYVDLCPCPAAAVQTVTVANGNAALAVPSQASTDQTVVVVGSDNTKSSDGAVQAAIVVAAGSPANDVRVYLSLTTMYTTYTIPITGTTTINGVTQPTTATSTVTSTIVSTVTSTAIPSATGLASSFALQIIPDSGLSPTTGTNFVVTDSRNRLSDNFYDPTSAGQYSLANGTLSENGNPFFLSDPDLYEAQVVPTNSNIGPLIQTGNGSSVSFSLDPNNNLLARDAQGPLLYCLSNVPTNDFCNVAPTEGEACDTSAFATSCEVGLTCAITPGSPFGQSTTGICRLVCLATPCPADRTCQNSVEARNNLNILFPNTPVCVPFSDQPPSMSMSNIISLPSLPSLPVPSLSIPAVSLPLPSLPVPSISLPLTLPSLSLPLPTLSVPSLPFPVPSLSLPALSLSVPVPSLSLPVSSILSDLLSLSVPTGLPATGNAASSASDASASSASSASLASATLPTSTSPTGTAATGAPITIPVTGGLHLRIYRTPQELAAAGISCQPVHLHAI